MTLIEEIKAKLDGVRWGHFSTSTVHELADLVRKLIDDIEGESHGHHDQAEPQGITAQEAGRSAGRADPGGETGESEEE